jgi:hypothetical protein
VPGTTDATTTPGPPPPPAARPGALGRALQRRPLLPTDLGHRLQNHGAYLEFRRIVAEILPEAAAEILAAPAGAGEDREAARCWAFLARVGELFPCYDLEEYDQVACGVPFTRNGWSFDRFHELDLPLGELLLFALCEQPYLADHGSRVALLDAAAAHVPRARLAGLPEEGISPQTLHERLDRTPFEAAAAFGDWLWGQTGTVFLDLDDETDVSDAEWTPEIVQELATQWRRASVLLEAIGRLGRWIEHDPPDRFARLLDAALGTDPQLTYDRERKGYACELTPDGLTTAVPRTDAIDPIELRGPRRAR